MLSPIKCRPPLRITFGARLTTLTLSHSRHCTDRAFESSVQLSTLSDHRTNHYNCFLFVTRLGTVCRKQNNCGDTPLHLALAQHSYASAKFLLEMVSALQAASAHGQTLWQLSRLHRTKLQLPTLAHLVVAPRLVHSLAYRCGAQSSALRTID